jgi:hypothetical protein
MTGALKNANLAVVDEGETTCCYAKSEKGWVHDPQGIAWENFVTRGESTIYGTGRGTAGDTSDPCCGPRDHTAGACCAPAAPA